LFYPALLYWLKKRDKKTEFNKFVDNYYEEGLLFNPIAATQEATTGTTIYCQTILLHRKKKQHDFTIKYQKLLKQQQQTQFL
jgi:hypothetical protein